MYLLTHSNKRSEYVCDKHIEDIGSQGIGHLAAMGVKLTKVDNDHICSVCERASLTNKENNLNTKGVSHE